MEQLATSDDLDENTRTLIKTEQADTVFQQALLATISNVLVGSVVYFIGGLATVVAATTLWFFALNISVVLRLATIIYFRYQHQRLSVDGRMALVKLYSVEVLLSGLIWCTSLLIFAPPVAVEYQLTVQMILVGYCVGALSAGYAYLPLVLVYNVPVLLSGFVYSMLAEDRVFTITMLSYPIYGLFISMLAYRINRDFLHNRTLRYALDQKRLEAERANLAKSRFLAATSHDLRQPLHAIALFSGALKNRVQNSEAEKLVDNIEKSVEALNSLFTGLLDISKLDAGSLETNRVDVLLEDVLAPLKEEFAALAQDQQLQLQWQATAVAVNTDVEVLRRIVRNLLSNAIRYTERGSVAVVVDAGARWVTIHVVDTGIGIAPQDQPRIFEEYVQLNNPERDRTKGLGLGLAIVSRLCQLMDYDLRLESQPGQGTRFSIRLPRVAFIAPQPVVLAGADTSVIDFKGMRVAVIDDEASIRDGAVLLLEDWGCSVEAYASRAEAIEHITRQSSPPDMILADYRLQNQDTGAQVIRALEQHFQREIPAAIITGDTDPQRIQEAKASGYLLLHKPLNLAQLRATLNRAKRLRARSTNT